MFVDIDEWDARAKALGGTSNSLLAGFAAKFAQRVGRVTAGEGLATLSMPINRTQRRRHQGQRGGQHRPDGRSDEGGQPTSESVRAAVKAALIRAQEVPDEKYALLPLVPFLSKRLVKKMVDVAGGGTTNICSSNLGDVDIAASRPDGTEADCFSMRCLYPRVTRATMHRAAGVLAMLSGRVNGRVFISVLAYDPARPARIGSCKKRFSVRSPISRSPRRCSEDLSSTRSPRESTMRRIE